MLVASYVIEQARIDLATPGGANVRWSDAQLLSLADRGTKRLVAETLFPETRLTLNTKPGVNEYQFPADPHVIHRVYVNGQPIVPVPGGIATLEGHQILLYDQSGNQGGGTNAAALSSGTYAPYYYSSSTAVLTGSPPVVVPSPLTSAAPFGSQGFDMPQWLVQTPVTYPFLNAWGTPAPDVQPYATGQRPRWYINGANIGLVPAPAGNAELVVDGVFVPRTLEATSDPIVVPDNFCDGIVAYMLWRAARANAMGDRSPASSSNRQEAQAELIAEERKLRTWKRQYTLESAQTMVLTYRGAFRVGGNTTGDYGDSW